MCGGLLGKDREPQSCNRELHICKCRSYGCIGMALGKNGNAGSLL